MPPDLTPTDEEGPVDEFGGPKQPGDFAQGRPDRVLMEYDGVALSYLAHGPRVSDGHEGSWLILLRQGGALYRPVEPSDRRERWLALPLSEIRRKQAEEGHLALLEVIGFSEWRPYVLTGPDPFNPVDAARLGVRNIPHTFFPTGMVSIQGRRLEEFHPSDPDTTTRLLVHLVPGKRELRNPSLWDAGSVQHALESFIETTQPFRRIQQQGAADIDSFNPSAVPATRWSGDVDWARLGLQGAKLGTLLLDLEMGTSLDEAEPGIRRALPELAPIAVDPMNATLLEGAREPPTGRTAVALLTFGGVLEAFGMSALFSWRGDHQVERVLVSPLSAHEGAKNLSTRARDEFASRQIRAPTVCVLLSRDEADPLNRRADREAGGFESLLADLKDALIPSGDSFTLPLRPDQVERVVRYVQSYGAGGAQERLRPVYEQLRRLGPSFGLLR